MSLPQTKSTKHRLYSSSPTGLHNYYMQATILIKRNELKILTRFVIILIKVKQNYIMRHIILTGNKVKLSIALERKKNYIKVDDTSL